MYFSISFDCHASPLGFLSCITPILFWTRIVDIPNTEITIRLDGCLLSVTRVPGTSLLFRCSPALLPLGLPPQCHRPSKKGSLSQLCHKASLHKIYLYSSLQSLDCVFIASLWDYHSKRKRLFTNTLLFVISSLKQRPPSVLHGTQYSSENLHTFIFSGGCLVGSCE